jgi:hypothetical protein
MRMTKFLTTLAVTGVVFIAGCNKGDWNNQSGPENSKKNGPAIQVNGSVTLSAPLAPGAVDLGVAGNFVILSKAGITDVPPSVITGDIGTSPITGASMTGITCPQVSGTIYTVSAAGPLPCRVINPGMLTVAVLNMQTAYTDAAGRTATSAATTNVGGGTLTDLTLAPGVYEWGSNVTIPTDLTLNGSATDVWIFNVNGTLDMASGGTTTGKSVILTGGALPQNIFWRVSGAVTLGTTSHFEGVILAMTNIAMKTGASINGRLLAQTAVTLDQNTVTVSGTSGGGTNPPVYCRDFVTGGGWINGNSDNSGHKNDKATFGVSGGIKNGNFWGQLSYNDHGKNGVNVKSTSVTDYIVIDAVTRRIDGLAKVNGHGSYAYSVVVTDNGEPGRDDHFILNVNIDGVRYHAEGDLIGGNIQLHMACGDSNDNHDKGDKNDHFKKDKKDDHNDGDKEDYSDKDENDGHHNCDNHE